MAHLYQLSFPFLPQVCSVLNQRLPKNEIWSELLSRDFGVNVNENLTIKTGKKSYRTIYKQELEKRKEAEIDWDNI